MFLSKKCKKSIGTNVIKDVRVPFLGSKENSSMLQHCKAPKIQKHVIFENDSNNNSIFNKQQKQAYLLDIAVPNSHNITQTYNTKINKYLELSVAMRNLWCLEKFRFYHL
jgi:hypothetical protein